MLRLRIAMRLAWCVLATPLAAMSQSGPGMADVLRQDIALASHQYGVLLEQVKGKPGFPRTVENGQVKLVGSPEVTSRLHACGHTSAPSVARRSPPASAWC